jgi:hypothetical protein
VESQQSANESIPLALHDHLAHDGHSAALREQAVAAMNDPSSRARHVTMRQLSDRFQVPIRTLYLWKKGISGRVRGSGGHAGRPRSISETCLEQVQQSVVANSEKGKYPVHGELLKMV